MGTINVSIDRFFFTLKYPVYIPTMYKVYWEEVFIGYIYYKYEDFPNVQRKWCATTEYTELYLVELSQIIDSLDT